MSFPEKCAAAVERLRSRGRVNFVCCVDGSRFSDAALECTKRLMKKHDHLCVYHAYSSLDDETLPRHKNSEAIKEKYRENLLATYTESRYSLVWVDRCEGGKSQEDATSIRDEIVKVADGRVPGVHVDFLVTGYEGWRGHDSAKLGDHPTTAGSNADFSMRHIHSPVILVKDGCEPGPKSYIMSVNASNTSKMGLDTLYTLLTPRDTLTVVHVLMESTDDRTLEATRRYYEEDLAENCPTANATFHCLVKPGAKPVADALDEYVNERKPSFFVLAPRAREGAAFTSITEQMILRIHTNIILCKT